MYRGDWIFCEECGRKLLKIHSKEGLCLVCYERKHEKDRAKKISKSQKKISDQ
jgi:DNA-directed RNA polymerase subunit M/transcription elongation factor TFIIS